MSDQRPSKRRCGIVNEDGEPAICYRWAGHDGHHRGAMAGRFYQGGRVEWEQDDPVLAALNVPSPTAPR